VAYTTAAGPTVIVANVTGNVFGPARMPLQLGHKVLRVIAARPGRFAR
jgi:hypothetical protein